MHALPSRRLAIADARSLESHLELHGGDADAWRAAAEAALTNGKASEALFAVEEMILNNPGSAAAHARASELGVTVAASYGNGTGEVAAARAAVRAARLHAAESVRLSDRSVAYALASLADAAWAHAALLRNNVISTAHRLLSGGTLDVTASRALFWFDSSEGKSVVKAAEAGRVSGVAAATCATTTTTTAVKPLISQPLTPGVVTQLREVIGLHALASHYLREIAGGAGGRALAGRLLAPAAIKDAPRVAVALPALVVDAALLWGAAAKGALAVQIADMASLGSALDNMEGGEGGADDIID